MRIFVCAGMFDFKEQDFCEQARKLGEILANNNHIYVQGGSLNGLMGETLREFSKLSKNVEFVIPAKYAEYDVPKLTQFLGDNIEIKIVDNEMARLNSIITCEKIIVLPGGTGTLEELLYCNETKRQKEHSAEIVLVNYKGFYDSILQQFENNFKLGLAKNAICFDVVNSVDELKL